MIIRGRVPLSVAALVTVALAGGAQAAQGATAQRATSGTDAARAAQTRTVYGFARPDGAGAMIVSPRKATRKGKRYRLTPIASAKEVRVTFDASVDYRRVTTACDLKETEGAVAVDAKGLGTTRCTDEDLEFTLGLGPVPVMVTYDPSTGAATRAREFLYPPDDPVAAFGTASLGGRGVVTFTPYKVRRVPTMGYAFGKKAGAPITLPYNGKVVFYRTGRSCKDNSQQPTSADRNGLGTRPCTAADLTRALRAIKPMQVKVEYLTASRELMEIREVFPCQGDICG
ncbi:hypothetical protein [Microtetraspora niveoalba]|uniref:hypothetical protein n=1 Tax=Microtetraspora niveoalba TaxID=46175 RepID=UPI0008324057|nr:hypothetical protein [Microtetraspora niveoalba]